MNIIEPRCRFTLGEKYKISVDPRDSGSSVVLGRYFGFSEDKKTHIFLVKPSLFRKRKVALVDDDLIKRESGVISYLGHKGNDHAIHVDSFYDLERDERLDRRDLIKLLGELA